MSSGKSPVTLSSSHGKSIGPVAAALRAHRAEMRGYRDLAKPAAHSNGAAKPVHTGKANGMSRPIIQPEGHDAPKVSKTGLEKYSRPELEDMQADLDGHSRKIKRAIEPVTSKLESIHRTIRKLKERQANGWRGIGQSMVILEAKRNQLIASIKPQTAQLERIHEKSNRLYGALEELDLREKHAAQLAGLDAPLKTNQRMADADVVSAPETDSPVKTGGTARAADDSIKPPETKLSKQRLHRERTIKAAHRGNLLRYGNREALSDLLPDMPSLAPRVRAEISMDRIAACLAEMDRKDTIKAEKEARRAARKQARKIGPSDEAPNDAELNTGLYLYENEEMSSFSPMRREGDRPKQARSTMPARRPSKSAAYAAARGAVTSAAPRP